MVMFTAFIILMLSRCLNVAALALVHIDQHISYTLTSLRNAKAEIHIHIVIFHRHQADIFVIFWPTVDGRSIRFQGQVSRQCFILCLYILQVVNA